MAAISTFELETHRGFLFGLGYRLLGSAADAEDLVQETFVRAMTANDDVAAPRGYLATIATRLGLDRLKSARAQREVHPGTWLPEPLANLESAADRGPEARVVLEDDISLAFLILLESLSPPERAALILHDVFAFSHAEIAEMTGATAAAVRQHLHRARERVRERRQRFTATAEDRRRVTEAFLRAIREGDVAGMSAVLAEDVVSYSDGGGKRPAAMRPVFGRDRVLRLMFGLAAKGHITHMTWSEANGEAALILWSGKRVDSVLVLEPDAEGEIAEIYTVLDPDKIRAYRLAERARGGETDAIATGPRI